MKIPIFADFLSSINLNSLNYDIDKFAPSVLQNPTDTFTKEQYEFLCKTNVTMMLALLQQYHEWLAKEIAK